jgi:uncharacterized alkaline shock family protein YloU
MTDFSADDSTGSSGPPPFAPSSPRREDVPFAPSTGAGTGASPGAGTGTSSGSGGSGSAPGGLGGSGSLGGASPLGATTGGAGTSAPTSTSFGGGAPNGAQRMAPEVKGRIDVADEVVEKVAGLAAMEVEGVADLGGDIERALEGVRERIGIGHKRGDQGIKAKISGREVSIDVTIMIEYGHVVMEVARQVKANVAHQTNRMLGLSVVEVNVTVDDIKMPETKKDEEEGDDGVVSLEG